MEYNLNKVISNLIEPQDVVAGDFKILTPTELNNIVPSALLNSKYPLQFAVTDRIIKAVDQLGNDGLPEMPDVAVTRRQWLRRWASLLLTHGQAWVIRADGYWKTFPSVTITGRNVSASDENGEYTVPLNSAGLSVYQKPPVASINQTEDVYWQLMTELRGVTGVASFKEATLQSIRAKDTAEFLAGQGKRMVNSPIGMLPGDKTWQPQAKFNGWLQVRDTILASYATAYALYPHEVGIGTGTNYGMGNVLQPMFEDLRDIVKYIDDSQEWTFKYWTVGGCDPNALMRLGQSGVVTTNEMREMLGLPPMEGEDDFPNTAGAPPTNMDNTP